MSIERELGRLAEAVEGLRADVHGLTAEFRGHAEQDNARFTTIELRHAREHGRRAVHSSLRGWGDRILAAIVGSGVYVATTHLLSRL